MHIHDLLIVNLRQEEAMYFLHGALTTRQKRPMSECRICTRTCCNVNGAVTQAWADELCLSLVVDS